MEFLAIAGLVLVSISCIISIYLGSQLNFFLLDLGELVQLCFKSYLMELLYEYVDEMNLLAFQLIKYVAEMIVASL